MRFAMRVITVVNRLWQAATNAVTPLIRLVPLLLALQCLSLTQNSSQQRTNATRQAGLPQISRPSPTPTEQLDKIEGRVAAGESAQAKNSSDTQVQLDRIEKQSLISNAHRFS